jgi:hypothetical protein
LPVSLADRHKLERILATEHYVSLLAVQDLGRGQALRWALINFLEKNGVYVTVIKRHQPPT